ncbi:unnamed protein product [Urochloa humidicola]
MAALLLLRSTAPPETPEIEQAPPSRAAACLDSRGRGNKVDMLLGLGREKEEVVPGGSINCRDETLDEASSTSAGSHSRATWSRPSPAVAAWRAPGPRSDGDDARNPPDSGEATAGARRGVEGEAGEVVEFWDVVIWFLQSAGDEFCRGVELARQRL